MTFGELFAGIGGIGLGLERAGMNAKWQVEIDDYANRVLQKHWPHVARFRDVRQFPPQPDPWLGHRWRERFAVDLIAAGVPCQDISHAGKRAGIRAARSGLFFEVVRVARILRPRWLLLENVAALLSNGMGTVVAELAAIGYGVEWHCIPAAAVGAPHIRDRVFIISHAESDRRRSWRPRRTIGSCSRKKDEAVLADSNNNPDETLRGECSIASREGAGGGTVGEGSSCITQREESAGSTRENKQVAHAPGPRLAIGENAEGLRQFAATVGKRQWAVEPDVGRVADGFPARVDRLRGLGNAVVPQVAEWIGQQIMEADNGES